MSPQIKHLSPHRGTGRKVTTVIAPSFNAADPVSFNSEPYVLFVALDSDEAGPSLRTARAWINAGASYVCAWGRGSSEVEDTFDHASLLPEVGDPIAYTLMTTSHGREPIEDALWFAFYSAQSPDDLKAELSRVVLVSDSAEVLKDCEHWVGTNAK